MSLVSFPLRSSDAYSNIRWTLITAKDINAKSVGRRSDISSTNFEIRWVPDGLQCAMWVLSFFHAETKMEERRRLFRIIYASCY